MNTQDYVPKFEIILTEHILLTDETFKVVLAETSVGCLIQVNDEGETLKEFTKTDKEKILKQLGKIDLSKSPKYAMGCDGVHYSITVCAGFNNFSFEWWSDIIDKNWSPLIAIRKKYLPDNDDLIK